MSTFLSPSRGSDRGGRVRNCQTASGSLRLSLSARRRGMPGLLYGAPVKAPVDIKNLISRPPDQTRHPVQRMAGLLSKAPGGQTLLSSAERGCMTGLYGLPLIWSRFLSEKSNNFSGTGSSGSSAATVVPAVTCGRQAGTIELGPFASPGSISAVRCEDPLPRYHRVMKTVARALDLPTPLIRGGVQEHVPEKLQTFPMRTCSNFGAVQAWIEPEPGPGSCWKGKPLSQEPVAAGPGSLNTNRNKSEGLYSYFYESYLCSVSL
jgi:hypothetical protein